MASAAAKVLKSIEENEIEYVDLRFTDPKGKWHHLTMVASVIDEDMLTDGFMFDGSSIAGWKAINESDMTLLPDLSSAVMDPFAAQASLILFCTDDPTLGPKELQPILTAFPQAAVLVRAFDRRQMIALAPLDLTASIREVYESAILMGIESLKALAVDGARIAEIEAEYRRRDVERLEAQGVSGDLHVLQDMMFRGERFEAKREA